MTVIALPQLAWYGQKKLEVSLPDSWQVEIGNMDGYNRPAMKPAEIKAALACPIGTAPIREMARGKHEVVIIFDDMTRVTRVAEIIPFVLDELAEAGIPDNKIRFVCALGCHGALTRLDFIKKLGEKIVARFPVYSHNPFAKGTYVGKTRTFGTEVYINEEVMRCDFKIAIGSVVPHRMSGFGGGGKIILPGVASFESIESNHRKLIQAMTEQREKPVIGMGLFDHNPMRLDIEEAAILAGLDVLIDGIINTWGETVALFAGALAPTYAAAIQAAKAQYLTPRLAGKDIVIANTFAKASEGFIGVNIAYTAVNRSGGDIVLITNAPEGQVTHYLMGSFGKTTAAPLRTPARPPKFVNHLIIYSEYPDLAGRGFFEDSEKVLYLSDWAAVRQSLQEFHGDNANVAVFPSAELQYVAQAL